MTPITVLLWKTEWERKAVIHPMLFFADTLMGLIGEWSYTGTDRQTDRPCILHTDWQKMVPTVLC